VKDFAILDLADQELVTALQIAPRASWSTVGAALGISGVTAARRWRRICDAGLAWVTAAPSMAARSEQVIAYVEVDCAPTRRVATATELAEHDLVVTTELSTGSSDILLTVAAPDLATLSRYLLDELSGTEEVLRTRVRIATAIYSEASHWRLLRLPERSVQHLERATAKRSPAAESEPLRMTADLQQVAELLSIDGRMSYTEIATRSGLSQTSVRRHVARLLDEHVLIPRTDVATELSGFPVQVYLWADAPVEDLPAAARALAELRNVRLCATVASAPSLMVCVWLRTVEEIHRFELTIAQRIPQVRVTDRLVVLRTVKRMGRLVDTSGRAVTARPINIWRFLDNYERVKQGLKPVARMADEPIGGPEGFRQV
jgi:DNA-binding Lrp family transcriptional regulator